MGGADAGLSLACTRASGAAPAERCNDGLNTGRAGPPRSLSDATPRCLIDQRRTEAPQPRGPRTTTAARALPPPGGGRPTRGSACERPGATSARCSDGLNTGRAGPPRSLSDVPKDSLGRPLACGPAPVRVDTDVPPPATRPGQGFPSAKSAGPGESPDTLDCPRSSSVRVPVAATGHRSLPNQRAEQLAPDKKPPGGTTSSGGGGRWGKAAKGSRQPRPSPIRLPATATGQKKKNHNVLCAPSSRAQGLRSERKGTEVCADHLAPHSTVHTSPSNESPSGHHRLPRVRHHTHRQGKKKNRKKRRRRRRRRLAGPSSGSRGPGWEAAKGSRQPRPSASGCRPPRPAKKEKKDVLCPHRGLTALRPERKSTEACRPPRAPQHRAHLSLPTRARPVSQGQAGHHRLPPLRQPHIYRRNNGKNEKK